MSHLQRRYTDYFYVEVEKKGLFGRKTRKLKKVYYLRQSEKILAAREKQLGISIPRLIPNAVFPCQHEERGFLPKKGKKHNMTRTRMKRKNKARIKARQRV